MLTNILRSRIFNGDHLGYLFYCTSSSIQTKPLFSKYLVESLGFTEHQSLSISSKLAKSWQSDRRRSVDGQKKVSDFKFAEKANSVVNIFKQYGFSDTQIRNAVKNYPRILVANVEKTITPKLWALQDQGFSVSNIADIISVDASLLWRGMDSTTLPTIRTLRHVLGLSDNEVVSFLKNLRWSNTGRYLKNMDKNVAFLKSYGIPLDRIRKHLCMHPSAYVANPKNFEEAVIQIELKLGIPRHSKMFLVGLRFLNKKLDSKIEAFNSFGWTVSDVLGLCRVTPACLTLSALTIRKKLGFLMNELHFTPADIISNGCMLACSLEKRVVPRHNVLMVLKQKGLVTDDCSFPRVVELTESRFLDKFVLQFPEIHQLYAKQMGINVEKLTLK